MGRLSSETVDALFTRLAVRYGAAWFAKWDGVPMDVVKADWSNELGGLRSDQIRYGLDHLPADFPPSVGQFLTACLNAPDPTPKLPPPKSEMPKRVAEELSRLAEMMRTRKPRSWAYELQEREKAGEILTEAQRTALDAALRSVDDASIVGDFKPIPERYLPPGGLREEP